MEKWLPGAGGGGNRARLVNVYKKIHKVREANVQHGDYN